MNYNQTTNETVTPITELVVLSHEDQRRLIQGSYQHPYGVFIRLAMFAGLRAEELLGLCWDDVDEYNSRLRTRRIQKSTDTEPLMVQCPSPRFVPLLPYVRNDLLEWREIQRHANVSIPPVYAYHLPVTLTLEGRPSTMDSLQEVYSQVLALSGVANYPFCALRDTFAVRCLEQGMHPQTLAVILGDPAAATAYAQFECSRQAANRAAMETLYFIQSPNAEALAYPVIITPQENGCALLYAPNFPETARYCDNLSEGLIDMRNRMEDDLCNSCYPPIPLSVARIPRRPNEFIVLMYLNP